MKHQITYEQVLEHENKLYQAIRTADLPLLNELLHADLLFIVPGGEVITKEMDLETYRSGLLKIDELDPHVEHLKIIDDIAVVTVTIALKGFFSGEIFQTKYRYIRFWKKNEAGIKVIGGSGVSI